MRQGLCQLSYSDMEPHLFSFTLLAAVLPPSRYGLSGVALRRVAVAIGLCSVRLSRMGATQHGMLGKGFLSSKRILPFGNLAQYALRIQPHPDRGPPTTAVLRALDTVTNCIGTFP